MTTAPCSSTIPLSRLLHQRLLDALLDGWRAFAAARRQRAERVRTEREMEAVADMNDALLRDIGAPDWMVAGAAARRDAQEMRLFELQYARDVDRLRGLS